jgi:hypothetical protein
MPSKYRAMGMECSRSAEMIPPIPFRNNAEYQFTNAESWFHFARKTKRPTEAAPADLSRAGRGSQETQLAVLHRLGQLACFAGQSLDQPNVQSLSHHD